EAGGRRRGEDLLAVLAGEVREDLLTRLAERELRGDLLLQRDAGGTLQVVAGVHRQAAAALTGERLLEIGLRRVHANARSSTASAAASARCSAAVGIITIIVPSTIVMPPSQSQTTNGLMKICKVMSPDLSS